MVTKKRLLGDFGELNARMFLVKHGFKIIRSNYTKRCGEIDIIARKNDSIHFIEVKTVSRETIYGNQSFSKGQSVYRPGENVDRIKLLKIQKTANLFILENNLNNIDFQIDLITVVFVRGWERPLIEYFENVNI